MRLTAPNAAHNQTSGLGSGADEKPDRAILSLDDPIRTILPSSRMSSEDSIGKGALKYGIY